MLEDFQGERSQISVPVRRTGGSQGAVSVNYSTTDGTATAGTDFTAASGTLNWADGDTDVKLIELATIPDSVAEGNEDFHDSTEQSDWRCHRSHVGRDQTCGFWTTTRGLVLSVPERQSTRPAARLPSAYRGAAQVGAVTVDYGTTSGSATSGSDFVSASGTLSWADGDTADKTILVDITNDMADESDETFTVTLSNPSGGTPLAPNSTATVTITDDDAPSGGGGNGGGGGGALDWLVVLFLAWRYLYPRLSSMSALGAG